MTNLSLRELLEKYRAGTLDQAERRLFSAMLQSPEHQHELENLIDEEFADPAFREWGDPETRELIFQQISLERETPGSGHRPALYRLPVFGKWMVRTAAAAAILFLFAGGYYWLRGHSKPDLAGAPSGERYKNDILPPVGNKTLLVLADGSSIALDSAHAGTLSVQGNTSVLKLNPGLLAYKDPGQVHEEMVYNTIVTQRGGKFQVVLSDGTKVWLNAASSLTFPTSFTGKERIVQVKGEAYFEIAKNADKPFIVKFGKNAQIQVLGTSFDVMAYEEEEIQKTTLLEGSVKLERGVQNAYLRPGQQAQLRDDDNIKVANDADLSQAIAWTKGEFQFEGDNIPTVMRQLARWYNIEVAYQGAIPDIHLSGSVSRQVNLSKVLQMLEMSGVYCRIDHGKVTVQP